MVIPITGRPAGWCDHIARFWPVDAVVGENGAFTLSMDKNVLKRTLTKGAASDPRPAIEKLGRAIQKKFPKAKWASDQAYREYDLAIDICEDVPKWKPADVERLLEFCDAQGAHAKLSSIHVNAWFGDYDKRTGFAHVLKSLSSLSEEMRSPDRWIYIGDSPNDEPLFGWFKNTVGVANLRPYLDRLKSPPRWITPSKSGAGFAEMANKFIQIKNN